ncbi:MAG: glycerol-3-phosphate 1-O-acyltransferase PlsY [Luteibaculaceae bacterium]
MIFFDMQLILIFLLAYFLGSIPTAVWVGKRFYKLDIRNFGSGNAGATNTFRILGKKAGIFVLFFDALKGYLAAYTLPILFEVNDFNNAPGIIPILLGCTAIIGHIFPVFARFRGGKGIATLLGVVIGLHWESALFCVGVFLISFLTTRIVSVSSMLAAIFFPVCIFFIYPQDLWPIEYFSIIFGVVVLVTHRSNIKRLLGGEEQKIVLRKKSG